MKTLTGIPLPPLEPYTEDEPTETNIRRPNTPDRETKALFEALAAWRELLTAKYGARRTLTLEHAHRAVVIEYRFSAAGVSQSRSTAVRVS
jgi:hypothetical protein